MGILRSLRAIRADRGRRQLERHKLSRLKSQQGLHLEPMEERMLMAIGAGPDLEEILSNDGAPLVAGDVRHVSPRELTLRFDTTQIINPATLDAIQVFGSGGDGFFAPGIVPATVNTAASATVFTGSANLSVVDDFYNGKVITFTSGTLLGQTATVIDYVGANRTFTVTPTLTATPLTGDVFNVALNTATDSSFNPPVVARLIGDRPNEVVLRFADRLPDDFYRIHIVGAGAGALTNTSGQPFNSGADLDFDFRLDLGTQVAAIVPQPVFRSAGALTYTNPDGGNGLDQIEVYFNQDALKAGNVPGGVENPAYYQLIFTRATATTGDDPAPFNPVSVRYFPSRAMALLEFAPGVLSLLDDPGPTGGVGTYRLRIGNSSAPLPAPLPLIVPGADPGSSFGTAHDLGALGTASQIIAGQTDVQPYGLTLPGGDTNPGHRELPGLSHLNQPGDSIDGLNLLDPITGLATRTAIYYDFRADYGVDPAGVTLTNQISPEQRRRVREAFDIYSEYLGVQFIETTPPLNTDSVPGSITIASGLLSAVNPTLVSGAGGVTAIAGVPNLPALARSDRLVVMDNADFTTAVSNQFGQAFFRGVMRQIGILLGFGNASDLPDLTINATSPSLFGNTGEPIFPGDADILHGQHLYRPESNDIDLFRFSVPAGEHGVFTAETLAERLTSGASSLDTVISFYGDVTSLHLPRGIDLQDGYFFTLSDGLNPAVTFEFNSQNGVTAGRRAVNFSPSDTAEQIAAKVTDAINDVAALDVEPVQEGNRVRLLGVSSVNVLNAPFVTQSTSLELLARNDDYFSEDSYLELRLRPGSYYVGVTSTGNTQFDPNLENSGFGGTTQGNYQLRLQFRPDPADSLVDASGVVLDGDGDGQPGGDFNFWFQASTATNTIYVDKVALDSVNQLGTLTNPFNNLPAAISKAQATPGKDIIRIVANGDPNDLTTAMAYELGAGLSDGPGFAIPQGTTVMVDPGVVFKLRQANIEIGSTSTAVAGDRSQSHLQVLGAPGREVYFTSYNNESIGADLNPAVTNPVAGDWGGLVFRNDVDLQSPGRVVLENEGVFLNFVNHASISYGGGELIVAGNPVRFNPLELSAARPTITNNSITLSAAAAISADPNSFADTKFQNNTYTADYERVGPEIHGNGLSGNSFNGLFVRVQGSPERTLDVPARFDDTDIVHILTSNLTIRGNPGGPVDPDGLGPALPTSANRLDARLAIDPGVIVKLRGARIETQIGAQLLAEGTAENPVLFIGLSDDRYGAGGTFNTNNDATLTGTGAPGEWGGLYFGYLSHGSIDHARITHGGGETTIEGGFANFNAIEIHRADVRVANSELEDNASGLAVGDRVGRGGNAAAVIFVRGAQPAIVNNAFQNNGVEGPAAISIDVNSLNHRLLPDAGRSTGVIGTFPQFAGNSGPLVRMNTFVNHDTNGMIVRGGTVTTQGVWDDTDVVHVVFNEIVVDNLHGYGGLRLQSSSTQQLIVKLEGATAGFTATGRALDIDDRIGGTVQIVGTPSFPVVLTSYFDDTIGGDTNNNGASAVTRWRSVLLQPNSNDRNLDTTLEREAIGNTSAPTNNTIASAHFLGELAPDQLSGDDNRRLGFHVHGYIGAGDVDIYSFMGRAGTEVWIDLDRTTPGLDTVVELTDGNGNVLARSNDSAAESVSPALLVGAARTLQRGAFSGPDLYTTNLRDAGMRMVLPFLTGAIDRYFIRVRSNSTDLAQLNNGRTTGSYDLQVRLQETDEFPGSTVQYSDIRFATTGIDIQGLPRHSPLVGDTGENPADAGNEGQAAALTIGNVLTTDRGSLSIAGSLAAVATGQPLDADWYRFTLDQDLLPAVAGDRTWALTFDIDYADGLSRPDTSISVFDSTGRLIYVGNESDILDDRSGTTGPASPLAGGSYGTQDAFLGTVHLPVAQAGSTYFVAVHSTGNVPAALNASFTTTPGAANELVRLEPIGSTRRIVEDHIGFTGYTSGQTTTGTSQISPESPAILDISSAISLQTHVRPFQLSDVTLFVSTGTQLSTVDPRTGNLETSVRTLGTATDPFGDIVIRNDGQMFGYQSLGGNATTAGRLMRVDPDNPALVVIGNDAIANATLTTDRVDALAYNRTNVGVYDLFYSVRNGGASSRLFRGNPTTGNAALTFNPFPVVATGPLGEIRNEDPAGAAIGITSGLAFGSNSSVGLNLAGTLFGVSDQGHFFTVDTINGAARILTSLPGVQFQGLSLGPQNLDFNGDGIGGDLANTFFAIDTNGLLYAIEVTAAPSGGLNAAQRAVFDTDNDTVLELVASTGLTDTTGLAFSPLDFNLWHPTFFHSADPGHGINPALADNSRLDPQNVTRTVNGRLQNEQVGGASFYFGLEQFQADPAAAGRYLTYTPVGGTTAVNAQYGVLSSQTQQDLSIAGVQDTYNLPGGAHGSLVTGDFSLSGYSATDKPTLYFNYYLRTQGANDNTTLMRDSARVFVSADGGLTWQMVATNNSVRAATGELPSFYSASSNVDSSATRDPRQRVQELFESDATREWRQARIDLGEFAGQANLRLRFDFSTAGDMNEAGLPGDEFGDFNSPQRGQLNSNEGFYVDDIVVGFAERGEMVTGAVANAAFQNLLPNPNAAAPQPTLTGQYQLEIRRGTEFASSITDASAAVLIDEDLVRDTNYRFAQAFSLVLPAGAEIGDGSTVTISDGLEQWTFQFDLSVVGAPIVNLAGKTVRLRFAAVQNAAQVAAELAAAIEAARVATAVTPAPFKVSALQNVASGDRLDLVGAAQATLLGVQRDVTVTLAGDTLGETAGANSLLGTVTRHGSLTGNLVVTLASSDLSEVQVPLTVTIPDGVASVNFLLSAIDDTEADGVQTVVITPAAAGYNGVSTTLDVTDDETATLSVTIPGNIFESLSAGITSIVGTVTRNTPALANLIVQLFSFDTTEAVVASTVTILAGQSSADFTVNAVDDLILDGLQNVTIAAAATGFRNGTASLLVQDDAVDTISATTPIWTAEGPSPTTIGQVEGIPDGNQVSGAIHTVLAHPTDPNTMYIGSANGGIWKTTNGLAPGGPTWVPLTDDLPALSIGALEFDITDGTSQTLIAGIGRFSSFAQVGSQLTGLLHSTDGGDSWTQLNAPNLQGQNFAGVAARGNVILAAANFFFGGGGLFRSDDTGATFTFVSGTNGLPSGAISDLVADPSVPERFYASVLGIGIFRTDDIGATWVNVTPAGVTFNPLTNNNIEMAVHANPGAATNAVYVAVMNNGQLANLLRSANQGTTWTALVVPTTNEGGGTVGISPRPNPGGQGAIHFSIVADPLNPFLVYVGGDRQPGNTGTPPNSDVFTGPNSLGARDYVGRLFRINASLPLAQQAVTLTHNGTASNSAPHADSREMVFNALGQIVEVDDGGIYLRTSPATTTGDWYSLNGNAQVAELHDIAYDSNQNTIIAGAQDTGTPEQLTPDGLRWVSVSTGDGGDVAVDDSVPGQTIHYSSFQRFGAFRRRTFDAAGNVTSTVFPALVVNGTGGQNFYQVETAPQFVTPLELNAINPARLVIAGVNSVYESFDRGDTLTSLGGGGGAVAMAYGGRRLGVPNPDVLWVGDSGNVLLRTTSGGSLVNTPGYTPAGGTAVIDLAIDPDDWMTAYVVDNSNQVFVTTNGGSTYTNITGNLSTLTGGYLAVQVIPGTGNDRIVVGTRDGLFQMLTSAPGVWSEYGALLPNALVYDLDYDARDGILVVATMGRGAFSTTSLGEAGNISVQIVGGPTVDENGNPSLIARVTRTTTQGDLPIVLSSNNTGKATIATSATILHGQTFVDVAISVLDNTLADGDQSVVISASAVGFGGGAGLFDVRDNETAGLTVSFSTANIDEDDGKAAATVTVSRNSSTTAPLVVTLVSSDSSEARVPSTVVIPAGQSSVTVLLDAIDDFAADGTQNVRITAAAQGHRSGSAQLAVFDDPNVIQANARGDENIVRPQGHLLIQGNRVTSSLGVGINVDAADPRATAAQPQPGVARNLPVLNTTLQATGVTIENNVVSRSGTSGIRVSGDVAPAGQPNDIIPFARIVNNTIYGNPTPSGIGIEVTQRSSPTILNNIVANLATGVQVDGTSTVVLGGMVYQQAPTNVAGAANGGLGSFPIPLLPAELLFLNAAAGDFRLVQGSLAIDSSINSLPERPELADVYAALGIAPSDVQAPELDITGRLRGDNPFVNSPPAQGVDVFKDRGAIERLDPVKITVDDLTVTESNSAIDAVITFRLSEPIIFAVGSGPLTVVFATADGTAIAGLDYTATNGTVTFTSGVTTATATVSVAGDALDELSENFVVNLTNLNLPTIAVIDDVQGQVVINDDDPLPAVFVNDVTGLETDAGTTSFVFVVNLSAPSGKEVLVQFTTRDGTATLANTDYNATTGILTFAPSQISQLVTVQVNGDPVVEPNEHFFVDLSSPVNATIGRVTAAGSIVDDEPVVTISGVTVSEGSIGTTPAVFTVLLNKVGLVDVVVVYNTAEQNPISAAVGADFTGVTNGSLTFAAGETSKTITVQVVADTVAELTEQFDLVLSAPINGTLGVPATATATILDDEPRISIAGPTVNPEGNSGTRDAVFTILLDRASTVPVTVQYNTVDGTAVSGPPRSDYAAVANVLTFLPGQTSLAVTVQVTSDTLNETTESFSLVLSNPTASEIPTGQDTGTATIIDDDPLPFFTITDVALPEGNAATTDFVFTVALTAESGRPVSVEFTTSGVSALAGSDFATTSGSLLFSAGETQKTITVVVNGDTAGELDETFTVNLSNPANALLGPTPQGIGTILDDEPRITISDASAEEGNALVFSVALSHIGAAPVSVAFSTVDITTASGDYFATSGTLTFAVGEVIKTITVTTVEDAQDEADETFQIVLAGAGAAVIDDVPGIGTIQDDDAPPTVSIQDTTVIEGHLGIANAVFDVVLSGASGLPISMSFATSDGTALGTVGTPAVGDDYQSITSGLLTFAPGQVTQRVTVQVLGDTIGEPHETFFVTLTSPNNAALADDLAVGTIRDDEPRVFIDDLPVQENSTDRNAVFVVRLDSPSGVSVVVNYATANGSATTPADYTALAGAVTFAPNETLQLVTVVVRGDVLDEDDETFLVNLTGATGAVISDGQATGQILDDDPLPKLDINATTVNEGDVGPVNAVFTVTLDVVSGRPVFVLFNTVDDSANAGSDYISTSGTLTFNPGQLTQRITVQVLGDTIGEPDEAFSMNLTPLSPPGVTHAGFLDSQGQGVIRDDEPRISILSSSIVEPDVGTTNLTFNVTLDRVSSSIVTVGFSTVDNTAAAGFDYFPTNGTLQFLPGQTQQTVVVPILGDAIDEINETFFVDLAGPSGNALIAANRGTGTISDNDGFPLLNIADAVLQEGDAGTTDMVFTVTLTPQSGRTVTVGYVTTAGTAAAVSDFQATSGNITFDPGQTVQQITVRVVGELVPEFDETFQVSLSAPVNGTIGDGQATGQILDDDARLSVSDLTINPEGNVGLTNVAFDVVLTRSSATPITVRFDTLAGTAAANVDYFTGSGTLTFAPGQTVQSASVVIVSDLLDESDETFFVTLSQAVNSVIIDTQGQATIVDDDAQPTLAVNSPAAVNEGDLTTTDVVFTVTLSAASGQDVTVVFATAGNTATSGTDFQGTSGTLTFLAALNEVVKFVTVPVTGDLDVEADETFTLNLGSAVNASVATPTGTGTILDDEPRLSAGDVSAPESNGTAVVPVVLSKASGGLVTVVFTTTGGTATAGTDFAGTSGTLTFQPGQTVALLNFSLVSDAVDEADETFSVDFSGAVGASISDPQAVVQIVDDDPLPTFLVSSPSVTEGDTGTVAAVFSISLSQASGRDVTVSFATADSTASAQPGLNDYVPATGSLTFAPGQTQQTVTVLVNGDTTSEPDETFLLGLFNAINASSTSSPGVATINDDEARIRINDVTVTEGNAGTVNAVFQVTLTKTAATPVTVNFATNSGIGAQGAGGGSDFTVTSGIVSFAVGQTVQNIVVPIIGDAIDEFDETFTVDLSLANGAVFDDAQGIGTIVDNDQAPDMSINSVTVSEGNPGSAGRAVFTVGLTSASARVVTARFATSPSSATAADFQSTTGTITFQPGVTAQNITVNLVGDLLDEANENFLITLSNVAEANLAVDTGMGSIRDDDARVFISDLSVSEADVAVNAVFNVVLSKAAGANVVVTFTTSAATATSGVDFSPATGTITFAPGQTQLPLTVPVLGDQVQEGSETFNVTLSILANSALAGDLTAVGTILDNDGTPVINIGDVQVTEGNSGTVLALFNVTMNGASGLPITVSFATANGTAIGGTDYLATNGILTFAPGQTVQQVSVAVVGDLTGETNETFTVNLSGPANATIGDGQGVGTIINDDTQQILVTGADAGGGPHVRVFNSTTGQEQFGFYAYHPLFSGGVRVAAGDVNGDGQADIITAAGRGGGPHVKVFDGRNGAEIASFYAVEPTFGGGLYVAAGDVNGDDRADIIVGTDGGPGETLSRVRVFDGPTLSLITQIDLTAASGFSSGARVAAGDVNGDGRDEIILASSPFAAPRVSVRDGLTGAALTDFFAYIPAFTGGVYVAAGDFNGDGRADIFTGAGPGGGPHVRVFDGTNPGNVLTEFYAYNPLFSGGVRVGSTDFNGDNRADVVTAAGPNGGPHVRVVSGPGLTELASFYAYHPFFSGGVFAAGSFRTVGAPLQASSSALGNAPGASLTLEQATPLVSRAASDWAAAGLSPQLVDRLRNVEVRVADLPAGYLALAYANAIVVDDDADGHGWFVDDTPWLDEEFEALAIDGLRARRLTAAAAGVDLLTVIAHELGHTLGLDHATGEEDSVMSEVLASGVRRRVSSSEVDALFARDDWK